MSMSTDATLPGALAIRPEPSLHNSRFVLKADDGLSSFSITRNQRGTNADAAGLVLLSGTSQNGRVSASRKVGNKDDEAIFTVYNSHETPEVEFRIEYKLLGSRRAVHTFSVVAAGSTSDFQWRNDGSGWELVMGHEPSSKHIEVLATGMLNIGQKEPPQFKLTIQGETLPSEMQWRVIAVASWLRIGDKAQSIKAKAPNPDKDATTAACCVVL